ncbi:MAG: hypothetical protein IT342_22180 [Candidatus Melainabacteria bacterium]|nr:hypothetical protein [Candidatus Melainabacteria bacterium]
MTFIEPASPPFEDQTRGQGHSVLMPEKTILRIHEKLRSLPRQTITSAELFALQRRFDRFINQLNPPRTGKI